RAGVHQDVRPYDPLDYVKNARVRGKLVSPAEMQMALPQRQRLSPGVESRLQILQARSKPAHLLGRQNLKRKEKPALPVLAHLGWRKWASHCGRLRGVPPHIHRRICEP